MIFKDKTISLGHEINVYVKIIRCKDNDFSDYKGFFSDYFLLFLRLK